MAARRGSTAVRGLLSFAFVPLVYTAAASVLLLVVPEYYRRATERFELLPAISFAVDSEQYTALMTTVAQAAAAMLALFFAAVSVVASTAYADVATEIRSLIPQDDYNRRYLRLLAHTAATSTIGVAVHALGGPSSSILAAYVVLLVLISLLAFLPLGVRTFALFDPAALTGYPVRAFLDALRSVTPGSRHWLDPSFQNHANGRAKAQLELFEDLLDFAIAEDRPHQDTVLEITIKVLRLTAYYAGDKPSIPSDSLWFTRKAEFKRWDVASSSLTELALQTGVSPSPEPVPDHGFVESVSIAMTSRCLQNLLARGALDEAVRLLLEINRTVSVQCTMYDQREATRLLASTRKTLVAHLRDTDETVSPLKQLQLVDVCCVAGLAPILSLSRAITQRDVSELLSIERSVKRLDRARSLQTASPRRVIEAQEDLLRRLEFEKSTEGTIETPSWYIKQILASAYAEDIRNILLTISETLEAEFVQPASDLIGDKRAVWAGVWLQRGIEACKKANDAVQRLDAHYEALRAFHITEAPWYPSGSREALNRIETIRSTIIRHLATICPTLCRTPDHKDLPDLVGQTRAWLAEELVSMMANRQDEGFSSLFVSYFDASVSVYGHYAALAQRPGKNDYIRVAMGVYIDMMELSGLALVFSELDSTQYYSVVCKVWDATLDSADCPEGVIRALYASIDSRFLLPILTPGAHQRFNWSRVLVQALADRGVDADCIYRRSWSDTQREPHSSAIVESISVTMGHSMDNPHEYFGALYLSSRPEASELERPRAVTRCLDSIARAQARINEYFESERDDTTEE